MTVEGYANHLGFISMTSTNGYFMRDLKKKQAKRKDGRRPVKCQ